MDFIRISKLVPKVSFFSWMDGSDGMDSDANTGFRPNVVCGIGLSAGMTILEASGSGLPQDGAAWIAGQGDDCNAAVGRQAPASPWGLPPV